jgi:hypothetical protein
MLLKSQVDQEQFDAEQEVEGVKVGLEQEKFKAEQESEVVKLRLEQERFDAEQEIEAEGVKFGLKMSENNKNE